MSHKYHPSRDELASHMAMFKTRKEWSADCARIRKEGGMSWGQLAYKCGKEFYRKYSAHFVRLAPKSGKPCLWWRDLTDDDIAASSKKYKSIKEWRNAAFYYYGAMLQRGSALKERCTMHMSRGANCDVEHFMYAFEFTDRAAYVGYSYRPNERRENHLVAGPIADHIKECAAYEWRIVESNIQGERQAKEREKVWIKWYKAGGWNMLNKNIGGSGGVSRKVAYTDDFLVAESLKYKGKFQWRLANKSQFFEAKKRGLIGSRISHMPRHKAPATSWNKGLKMPPSARLKISAALVGMKKRNGPALSRYYADKRAAKANA